MKAATYLYRNGIFEEENNSSSLFQNACQLVLGFGSKQLVTEPGIFTLLKKKFPSAHLALCSTAGEISGTHVYDNSISLSAIHFEKTPLVCSQINVSAYASSYDAGAALIGQLPKTDLKHIFVLSDGSQVNGSELVSGMSSVAEGNLKITGGLAGDAANFQSTAVGLNEVPKSGNILAIGFYGDAIEINFSSKGGWESFGLEKKITRSVSNELFEINGKSALDVYKDYLGKYAKDLPGSALLFPLSIKIEEEDEPVVRTILSINEERNSMTFAGNMPQNANVRFMKANFDKLVDASGIAAQNILSSTGRPLKLAVLISCVGRKLILRDRIEEEIDAIKEILHPQTLISGFYSYGEISPSNSSVRCELYNQTMTITTFDER